MSAVLEDVVKLVANNLKCSICFEVFVEPVTLGCGHNYCMSCIESHLRTNRTCPQCRSPHSESHTLRKNVTLSNIVCLQEAGGRQMWREVISHTDQCRGNIRDTTFTRDALEKRLELLKVEMKSMETLLTDLNATQQEESILTREGASAAGTSRSLLHTDSGQFTEQAESAVSDPEEGVSVDVRLRHFKSAEFVRLTFSPEMGHRRLTFIPESRRMEVRSVCCPLTHSSRFDISQWMADQQFDSGTRFWDVDVSKCSSWAAGVAYGDLGRSQRLGRASSWCLERSRGKLSVWNNGTETLLKHDCLLRVRVQLDMDNSRLSFWSWIEGENELDSIQTDFHRPVHPVFWLFGTQPGNALFFPLPCDQ